jgi:hypothetical protein
VRATNLSSFVSGIVFGLFLGFLYRLPAGTPGLVIPLAFFSTLLIGVIGGPELIAQVRGLYLSRHGASFRFF